MELNFKNEFVKSNTWLVMLVIILISDLIKCLQMLNINYMYIYVHISILSSAAL